MILPIWSIYTDLMSLWWIDLIWALFQILFKKISLIFLQNYNQLQVRSGISLYKSWLSSIIPNIIFHFGSIFPGNADNPNCPLRLTTGHRNMSSYICPDYGDTLTLELGLNAIVRLLDYRSGHHCRDLAEFKLTN